MRNRVSICTLIMGLICPFTQVARGKQPGPVQPPPSAMIVERPTVPLEAILSLLGILQKFKQPFLEESNSAG
jgi:hypothetical protein